MNKIILQKYIVDSGYASRRQATELIKAGKVKVNGQVAEPGLKVFPDDEVRVAGKKLAAQTKKIYIILNKPAGYVCSNRKFHGENNVFDLLVDNGRRPLPRERLFIVGRLDKSSRGLLLITNDGELAQRVTHPSYGHEKVYEVKLRMPNAECRMKKNQLINSFIRGIDIGEGDGIVKAKDVKYLGDNKFKVVLTQGVKRQIRRMFKALGYEVSDLKRTEIKSKQFKLDLGDLQKGKWRCLCEKELAKLK